MEISDSVKLVKSNLKLFILGSWFPTVENKALYNGQTIGCAVEWKVTC